MKLTNFKDDFNFSDPQFFRSSDEEDKEKGIDFWFCNLPVAYRKRRINCPDDITIRYERKSGAKTEYHKILSGEFQAKIFIFDFLDRVVFCSVDSIKSALSNYWFEIKFNKDNETSLAIVDLKKITFLTWEKGN